MLPRNVLDILGAALVGLGVAKYFFSGYTNITAIVVGLGLGAATVMAGRIGGGPQPVPEGGYDFDSAMRVLRRATWGGITVGAVLSGLAFYLWIIDRAGPLDVLLYFALGLLVAYASLVAAAGLVLVDVLVKREGPSEPSSSGPEEAGPGPGEA